MPNIIDTTDADKVTNRVSYFDGVKNLALSSLTKLDPKRTNKYQIFTEAAMRTMLRALKSNLDYVGNAKHAELIDKWENKIAAGELLSENLCAQMVNELSAEIAKVDPDAAKKYQEDASAALKTAFAEIEKNSEKADERWKWQLLQMFTILTPLGAFSIAGQVFNYLGPLTELFGELFSSEGLAQGIVNIMTSEKLGPFAWLVDNMEVDYAVKEILTKTPILSDLLDTASLISSSEILHDLGSTVAPSTGSELPLVMIAGALVLYQTPDEIDHQKAKSDSESKKKEALKKINAYPIKTQKAEPKKVKEEKKSDLGKELNEIVQEAKDKAKKQGLLEKKENNQDTPPTTISPKESDDLLQAVKDKANEQKENNQDTPPTTISPKESDDLLKKSKQEENEGIENNINKESDDLLKKSKQEENEGIENNINKKSDSFVKKYKTPAQSNGGRSGGG